ncbi:hypothetical protein SAMN05444410_10861 [Hydrobacter penzbergensis]|uniref:Uncharacterized protein n=1 Tax=Hydrobacter penzbergensis TaxID=1235997 RepID=A0A8X8IFV2_9BACT|nr:hypothetical protein [Hydrobacter penzbergensis]SDX02315.1 hypothetical protein SAMN05444410_10861 [Hydrobacter penzbergensis]
MKTIFLLWGLMLFAVSVMAQGSYTVSQSVARFNYCTTSQSVRITGKVTSFTSTQFKGITFYFYYYNPSAGYYNTIGYFICSESGGTFSTNYTNIDPSYFNGAQISFAGSTRYFPATLWIDIDVPYSAFPNNNNTGQQLAVDIVGTDQYNSTTTNSSKTQYSVPLLYTNAVTLSSPTISASPATICSSTSSKITSSPNYAPYGFLYDWYKDGVLLVTGDASGTLSTNQPGNYYAVVRDICQSVQSNTVALNASSVPAAPAVSSSSGLMLCNGASTVLSASPTAGGTLYWNTGATGNSITVSAAGNYYCWEVNSCGQGPNSNTVSITTSATPSAPSVSSSAGTLLCNGATTTLSASGAGAITWNTGATGGSITATTAGSYYATASNTCGTSAASNVVVLSTGSTPAAPSISSSNGSLLCNGATTILTATGVSGPVTWSNGQIGNSITVGVVGSYYAYQSGSCGTSGNSNTIAITTGTTPAAPSVSTNATLLCNGSAANLVASNVTGTVTWNTGQTGSSITVSSAGTYYAYQTGSCGASGNSNSVSIVVGQTPAAPTVSNSNGTFLCNGVSTTLSTLASAGGTIYWNTGQSGNAISVSSTGGYYAYESNGCGNSNNSNTVSITTGSVPPAPVVAPSNNVLLCNGTSTSFSATGSQITWSNGTTGNTVTTSTAGTYYAYDKNSCGNSSNSNPVVVTTGNCPTPLPGSSFQICPGMLKTLDAGAGYESYHWNTGATTQTISVGPGTYSVTVTKEGCTALSGSVTVSYFSVTAPVISPSGSTVFCQGGGVTLTASGAVSYVWNTGETGNSIHVSTSGTYTVTATDGNGCQTPSSPLATTVRSLPTATVSGSATVCQGSSSPMIVFSGSGGVAPYTFTYQVGSGAAQTITTTTGNNISVAVPTASAGSTNYRLISVQESSSTACSNTVGGAATIVVNPIPTAAISGTATVCQNAASPVINFSGSGGTAPYTFTYRVNGGTPLTIATSVGSSVTVPVSTGTPGNYTYTLISVQDGSNTACSNAASGSAIVTVNPLPTATIAGTVAVCQNTNQPVITFTGSGGVAPYTFTYNIGSGANQFVTTTSGNSVSVSVPTNTPGSFVYNLVSVKDASAAVCTSAVSGSATVTVNALPTAVISGTTSVCQNSASPVISFVGSGGVAPYVFTYSINGGANQTVTSNGNTASIATPTITAGSFTYTLISVKDGSSTTCSNVASGSAVVTVNPLPTASFSGATTVCQNSMAPIISFTGAGGTAPYTFTYRINGGANQTITSSAGSSVNLSVPTSVAGNFNYSLVSVQDGSATACSASATASVMMTVHPQPEPAVITTADLHLCNGSSGVLTILNWVNGNTYQWYLNSTAFKTSTADTIVNTKAGKFTVRSISADGCNAASLSDTVIITIGSVATPQILGYRKVCEGGKTLLTVNNRDQRFSIWRWTDPPDKPVPRAQYSRDSSFFAQAGQYQVWVMREGCFDSTQVTVTADDTEYPAGEIKLSKRVTSYGGEVELTGVVVNASSFHWDFGNGNQAVTTGNTIRERYYKTGDSVLVQLDAVSPRNCITHFSTWLRVLPESTPLKRELFVTGSVKDWNVFPIPFHDHLNVSVVLKRKQEVRIDLFSADGKRIRSWIKSGGPGEHLFNLEGADQLTAGVLYFMTAVYNGEKHFDKVYKY